MELYCGIDLHGNNNVIVIANKKHEVEKQKRLPNDMIDVLSFLKPFKERIISVAVESTYNWYWLVDGLIEAGYYVKLANPTAMQQYSGLKFSDDKSDARWIAKMLALDILPTGYIYPKQERGTRDLLRKRSQLVRFRTSNVLSINTLLTRNTGKSMTGAKIIKLQAEDVKALLGDNEISMAALSNLTLLKCLKTEIKTLEKHIKKRARLKPEFNKLLTVGGIGEILALTISLETGDITRFKKAGNYSSYCRCVKSERISNGKKKGSGNKKNGNKYLAWAFIEAANFAIRYNKNAEKFYQRKRTKRNEAVAKKAVANKLAKACYYIMQNNTEFDDKKCFAV